MHRRMAVMMAGPIEKPRLDERPELLEIASDAVRTRNAGTVRMEAWLLERYGIKYGGRMHRRRASMAQAQ